MASGANRANFILLLIAVTMSRREDMISKRLEAEKTQLRSILSDFRKTKHKCLSMSEEMGRELPGKPQYDALEREIALKIDLLDANGLLGLKNKLVHTLSELFDIQNDLSTDKEREAAKKQFSKLVGGTKNSTGRAPASKNISLQQPRSKPDRSPPEDITQPHPSAKPQPNKTSAYNVPLYHIQQDSAQNKVQRITKFVASLKSNQQKEIGNMKMHSADIPASRVKEMLEEDPEYIAIKQELDNYRRKERELEGRIKDIEAKAVQKFINQAEIVEESDSYKIIKIYKTEQDNKLASSRQNQSSTKPIAKPVVDEPSPPRRLRLAQMQLQIEAIKEKRKDPEILEIQKSLEQDHYNVEAVVSKINVTLERNEQKLRKLRQQRMKIFERDAEVWNQLQQL